MKHKGRLAIAIALLLALAAPVQAATPKAGAKCTKAGSTATASGKKYTCVKSGTKLVWNKGVAIKTATKPSLNPVLKPSEPVPSPSPVQPPASEKQEISFVPWSVNASAKAINDAAQANFRTWASSQNSKDSKHKLIVQENVLDSRRNNFQSVDIVGDRLFGQFFSTSSATVIGSSESWVLEKLNSNGGSYKSCSENAGNGGLNYCHDGWKTQGYVITQDLGYDAQNPGADGSSLLAHEYFHLVQSQLANYENKSMIKGGYPKEESQFPVWLIEGSANFVGFSVSALTLGGTYWEGRKAMFNYAPQIPGVNSHALEDYEFRNGPGNYSPTYPYIVGQLATEYLVASVGFERTLDIWRNIRETKDFKKSFEKSVGISLNDFYNKFEAVRTNLGLPIVSYKLVCLTSYKFADVPKTPGPCILDQIQSQGPNPPAIPPPPPTPPPGSEPPPVDRTSNVDGLGCRNREPDLVNSFGTFVCTELAGGNNLWRRKS